MQKHVTGCLIRKPKSFVKRKPTARYGEPWVARLSCQTIFDNWIATKTCSHKAFPRNVLEVSGKGRLNVHYATFLYFER